MRIAWLTIVIFLSAAACRTDMLDGSSTGGDDLGPGGPGGGAGCATLTTADACEARADCHARFSGSELCNSLGCANHFEICEDGAAARCTPVDVCIQACTGLQAACNTGDEHEYGDTGCCPTGCVHADHCS